MAYFDELLICCDVSEDSELTLTRFERGLQPEICHEMMFHTIDRLEVAFHRTCDIENYQKVESQHSLPLIQIKQPPGADHSPLPQAAN